MCKVAPDVLQALPMRSRFSGQELSNLMWALANLQHELPEAVLREVSEEFSRLALRMQSRPGAPRERLLANMVWACARLRVNPLDGALLRAACALMLDNPQGFLLQHMSNLVLAAGILQHPLPPALVHLVSPCTDTGSVKKVGYAFTKFCPI